MPTGLFFETAQQNKWFKFRTGYLLTQLENGNSYDLVTIRIILLKLMKCNVKIIFFKSGIEKL